MTVFLIIAATIFASTLITTMAVLPNLQPGKKKVQADLKKMKEEIKPWVSELVPLGNEELESMSTAQSKQVIKKRLTTTAKGVFSTIFEEPIVAYSYRRYIAAKENAILYVRTASKEIAYRIKNGKIQIVVNNKPLGVIKTNGALYSAKNNRLLARINREPQELLPVIVKDREVGSMVKHLPSKNDKGISGRVFEFVRDDMDEEEKEAFLSLTVLEMVTHSLPS